MRPHTLRMAAALGIGLGLLAVPSLAAAQYPDTAPVRPFNLPDLSGLTAVNLDLQLTWWTFENLPTPALDSNFTNMTLELAADINLAPHWVLVARMPIIYSDIETSPEDVVDCCGTGIGNLTLGVRGLFSARHGGDLRSVLGGEFALSLATASNEDEAGAAAVHSVFARASHDPGRYLPDTWTPRLNGHAQIYTRWLVIQAEAGLHIFLFEDEAGRDDDSEAALRLALAAGVRVTPELALLVELNNMVFIADDDNEEDDDTATSVDLGLRYGAENLVGGLRLFLPLDEERSNVDMMGVGIDLGARF